MRTNKNMNEKGFSAKMETIDEIVFDCMRPKKLSDDQNSLVLAFKRSVEKEIEERNDNRNWAIREIPLIIPNVDLA